MNYKKVNKNKMKFGKTFPVSDLPSSGLTRNKAETARKIRAAHSSFHTCPSKKEKDQTKGISCLLDKVYEPGHKEDENPILVGNKVRDTMLALSERQERECRSAAR